MLFAVYGNTCVAGKNVPDCLANFSSEYDIEVKEYDVAWFIGSPVKRVTTITHSLYMADEVTGKDILVEETTETL